MRPHTQHLFGISKPLTGKDYRFLRGPYTQTELAAKIEVNVSSVMSYESGRYQPDMTILRRLLDHFTSWQNTYQGVAIHFLINRAQDWAGGTEWQQSESTSPKNRRKSSQKKATSASSQAPPEPR